MFRLYTFTCIKKYIHVYIYLYICINIYVYIYEYICKYIYIYKYIYTFIYIYVNMYIYIYMHTYIRIMSYHFARALTDIAFKEMLCLKQCMLDDQIELLVNTSSSKATTKSTNKFQIFFEVIRKTVFLLQTLKVMIFGYWWGSLFK